MFTQDGCKDLLDALYAKWVVEDPAYMVVLDQHTVSEEDWPATFAGGPLPADQFIAAQEASATFNSPAVDQDAGGKLTGVEFEWLNDTGVSITLQAWGIFTINGDGEYTKRMVYKRFTTPIVVPNGVAFRLTPELMSQPPS